jgi:hypothetical protein
MYMKAPFVPSLILLIFATASETAADLAKIDRTIAKEPVYQSKPRYCLIVFGLEAKTRVWLVLDGDALFVDRNGNGDLTEKSKRILMQPFKKSSHPSFQREREILIGDIEEGELKHSALTLTQIQYRKDLPDQTPAQKRAKKLIDQAPDRFAYVVTVKVNLSSAPHISQQEQLGKAMQVASFDSRGFLLFADRAQDAPVIHFNGPLQMGVVPDQTLSCDEEACDLKAQIITHGIGKGTDAILFLCAPGVAIVPNGIHPVAEIAFPAKAGTVRSKFILSDQC